jgi:hypothetical protein
LMLIHSTWDTNNWKFSLNNSGREMLSTMQLWLRSRISKKECRMRWERTQIALKNKWKWSKSTLSMFQLKNKVIMKSSKRDSHSKRRVLLLKRQIKIERGSPERHHRDWLSTLKTSWMTSYLKFRTLFRALWLKLSLIGSKLSLDRSLTTSRQNRRSSRMNTSNK